MFVLNKHLVFKDLHLNSRLYFPLYVLTYGLLIW